MKCAKIAKMFGCSDHIPKGHDPKSVNIVKNIVIGARCHPLDELHGAMRTLMETCI